MSHSNDVDDAVAKMLALGTAGAAAAQQPSLPAPPAAPLEPPAALPEPSSEAATPVPAQQPRTPRAKAVRSPSKPPAADQDLPRGAGKEPVAVAMDRDLVELMRLARPALGGLKIAQIMTVAARQYRLAAADLPDTPIISTMIDDWYDEVETVAAHRVNITPYMTRRGRENLDADAKAVRLDRSSFVRRVVRAYLTVDRAFLPVHSAMRLQTAEEAVAEELAAQIAANRPALALPSAVAGQMWVVVELAEGSKLRQRTDEARKRMPGCLSATQALLTVL